MHAIAKELDLEGIKVLMGAIADLMEWMNKISVSDLNLVEVIELAINKEVTFYDAAYIAAAKLGRLVLVTDDAKLARVASRLVKVKSSKELKVSP